MTKQRFSVKLLGQSYQPQPARPSKSIPWRRFIWLLVAVVAIFLFLRLPILRVSEVAISGTKSSEIERMLNGLKGASIFSSRISATKEKILATHGELSSLTCRRGIPSSLNCHATVRQPVLRWTSGKRHYFVDRSGLVFGSSESHSGLLEIVDSTQTVPKSGSKLLSAQIVEAYLSLDEILNKNDFSVTEYIVGESLFQISAKLSIKKRPLTVLFSLSSPAELQIKTLKSVLGKTAKQFPAKIDLRVYGYVYYR